MAGEEHFAAYGYVLVRQRLDQLAARLGLGSERATVRTLSPGSVSLTVESVAKLSATTLLELANPARGFSRLLAVRVVRAEPAAGGYVVDAEFTPELAADDLLALLS